MRKYQRLFVLMLVCCAVLVSAAAAGIGRAAPPRVPVHENENADTISSRQRVLYPAQTFFVPHWYVKAQGGAAYDLGEAKFADLLSPEIQLSLGYQPTELFGLRGSVSGFWARNHYAYPEAKYQWNFVQGTIDAGINLSCLFFGSKPDRLTHTYAFVGAGVNWAFDNDDAVQADKRYGVDFQKLWKGNRLNPVIRAGLGMDYSITENIAIGCEVSANMLPDHFNSKRGRRDNKDWHFNALVGVKFTLGHSYGKTEPVFEKLQRAKPTTNAAQFVDVPIDKISFNVNIYFLINQSIIRSNQISKLSRLIDYLNEHPRAFVRLSGYADKDTGTPPINMRLSIERSQVVSKYLQDAGIEEWRIRRFAKGDTVQPFDIPEDNRVCICYVYDPDNPIPQQF